MNRPNNLERLLNPRNVAVIGGDSAAEVVRQCQALGFSGELWAVSPSRKELAGIPCVRSVRDLPAPPDASFVAAPPQASLDIVRELSSIGAAGAVCFAAGFAETGVEGTKLQQELSDAANDMAIIGPNCHGFLNYLDGVALWPDQHGGRRAESGVALVSQSGNIAINLTMQQRGLDFAYVISVGNNSSLKIHDYIDALLCDSRVNAIGLHIEGIDDVAAFSTAAIRALSKGVPVVALKTGRSSRGAEITLSHTGSLSGSDKLYEALFKRVGVARCNTITQFLETLKFLSIVGPLTDRTIGSMSCSGGDASLVADCAETLGLDTPLPSAQSTRNLQQLLGPKVSVNNPLDYHLFAWGDYKKLNECFTEFLSNNFSCSMLVLDYPPGNDGEATNWETAERALVDAVTATAQHAVIVSSLPENLPLDARNRLKSLGIAPMQGIEDCLYAIRAAAIIGAAQKNSATTAPVMRAGVIKGTAHNLNEWDSKQILKQCGVDVPDGKLCKEAEVLPAADTIAYPLVLKAVSSELVHKSDAGAVFLKLPDRAAVHKALQRLRNDYEQFLVEEMVDDAHVELIVGVVRDKTFGLTMLIGAGGTLVELVDDSVSLLLPVTRRDIGSAIQSLKAGRLIQSFRNDVSGNEGVLLSTIEAIATYAIQNQDSLLELDVNPLLVLQDRVVAADAFIRTINPTISDPTETA